ncbi:FliI/YscN family ATPase [Primorskyibacter sp. S87]|uniref:FliI/YscN family ATPase n=1 Tax=Primorskyibacter sp. S87 TaxID=3415126 RepID=UPI003C7DF280
MNFVESLKSEIKNMRLARPMGRVIGFGNGLVQIAGLARDAKLADSLVLQRTSGLSLTGEVLGIEGEIVHMIPETEPYGVSTGTPVTLRSAATFSPGDHWIGRVIDPFGQPMDGKPLMAGDDPRDLLASAPDAGKRRPMGERIPTGLAVLDTVLPIACGQRVGLFAGSGVGKSSLLAELTQTMAADVVVIALIGERGREVSDFVSRTLGPEGMARSVVVAATSDKSALTRRRCAWSAMTVAEYFRDQGCSVLFLADSITRFAEAHREISLIAGEKPALRGFPPSVSTLITALSERAGPGAQEQGDITAVFSVLVAGSDMEEPIADIMRGVLDGHFVLSRDIAERGRYPAIDVGKSVSRCLPDAASEEENRLIAQLRQLIGAYEQSEVMIKAGLYSSGSDPLLDQAVHIWPEIEEFCARREPEGQRASFDRLSLLLRRARAGRPA